MKCINTIDHVYVLYVWSHRRICSTYWRTSCASSLWLSCFVCFMRNWYVWCGNTIYSWISPGQNRTICIGHPHIMLHEYVCRTVHEPATVQLLNVQYCWLYISGQTQSSKHPAAAANFRAYLYVYYITISNCRQSTQHDNYRLWTSCVRNFFSPNAWAQSLMLFNMKHVLRTWIADDECDVVVCVQLKLFICSVSMDLWQKRKRGNRNIVMDS